MTTFLDDDASEGVSDLREHDIVLKIMMTVTVTL